MPLACPVSRAVPPCERTPAPSSLAPRSSSFSNGLDDRGRITPGWKADLNVIDFDKLRVEAPVMKWDLPAGGKRLLQKARGYRATVVSGAVTYRDGEATGALPGRLVRGPQVGMP